MLLRFTVPGPPVPCARPRAAPNGHVYMPAKTQKYKAHVRNMAAEAMLRAGYWNGDATGYKMRIRIYRAALRGDIDNYSKGIQDALNGLVYADDRYITELHVVMDLDRMNPRAEVEVEAMNTP